MITPSDGAPPMPVHDFCYMLRPHVLSKSDAASESFTVLVDDDNTVTCKFPVMKGKGDERHRSSFATTHRVDSVTNCKPHMTFGSGARKNDTPSSASDDDDDSAPPTRASGRHGASNDSDSGASDDGGGGGRDASGKGRGGYESLRALCRKDPRSTECKKARAEEDKFSRRNITSADQTRYERYRKNDMERLRHEHYRALNTRPVKWNETFDAGRDTLVDR